MADPIYYLHLQLRLEGREIVEDRFLREVESVPGEETPLMLIAGLADGRVIPYYDAALSPGLQEALEACISRIAFPVIDPLLAVLKNHHVQYEVGHYKTYVFPSIPEEDDPAHCLSKDDSRVKAVGFDGFAEQMYVIEREGNVVSACVSTREDERCGEAWVFTAPEYRHQGYARQAVNAWAGSLMRAGKIPFYSHKIDNTASARLAGKLGLRPVFEEIAILHT